MPLTISAVLPLGLLIFILVRLRNLRLTHAVLCAVFGFLLAETAAAPDIATALEEIAAALGQIET
jgi:hypothetical protein